MTTLEPAMSDQPFITACAVYSC